MFKPSRENMNFLEIEHLDTKFSSMQLPVRSVL
jgi:hypothetical protein